MMKITNKANSSNLKNDGTLDETIAPINRTAYIVDDISPVAQEVLALEV